MKTINFFRLSIIASFIILMQSCAPDNSADTFTEDKTATSNFVILPITHNNVRNTNYLANYQVEQVSSEINFENDNIQLEIPISVNDFTFFKAYNVSTKNNLAILYVIQREKQNVVVDLPTSYVIQDELSISELNLNTNLLEQNGCVRIYVMNNSEKDMLVDEDLILNCLTDSLDKYNCDDTYAYPELCSTVTSNNQNKRPGTLGGGIIK